MRLFKTSAGRYINLDRMTSCTPDGQICFDEFGGDNDNFIQVPGEDRDRLKAILEQDVIPESQPVVSRPDMAEVALKLFKALNGVWEAFTDDTSVEQINAVIAGMDVALEDARSELAAAGLLEVEDESEEHDTYDGFGPMGPPNADITQGVDPDLYAHAPYCDCRSCAGVEPVEA